MRSTVRFLLLAVLLVSLGDGCRRKTKGPYFGAVPTRAP